MSNKFIVNESKQLRADFDTSWYVGEDGFEHFKVFIPPEISGNDMSQWLEGIKLIANKDGFTWERELTFTESEEGGYESDIIDADAAWSMTVGNVYFRVQFSKESELGVTNDVSVYVNPSDQGGGDIPYDELARKDWVADNFVPDAPDGTNPLIENDKINPVYLDGGSGNSFIYGGVITSVIGNYSFVITPSEAMQERIGTTETSVTADLTDEIFQQAYYRGNSNIYFRGIKANSETIVSVADASNVFVITLKPEGNIDSFIVRVAPVNGQPPGSGSYPIPTGALCPCTDAQTDENYTMVCVNSRYNGNQWTYTWQRFSDDSNVVHKTGDEVRTGSIKTQNENTSQDYAYSIVADNQIAVKHDSGSGTFMTDDGVKTGGTQYTKYGNRDIYIQRSNYGVTLNMPNSSGTLALKPTSTTATLLSNGWSNGEQTVNVSGVTATNDVFVSIAPSSMEDASASQIYCSAQGNGTLTFVCKSEPSNDISVNIMIVG